MHSHATVAFRTFGCRLNQAETAQIAAVFEKSGYKVVPFGETCDVCVIHGCTITARAEKDSLRAVRRAGKLAGIPLVVMAGCPVEAAGFEAWRSQFPRVLCAGQADKFRLPALIHAIDPLRFPPPWLAPDGSPPHCPTPLFDTARAWIKAQDGCDFGCAYCVVPHTRGPARSRPLPDVLSEIERTTAAGHREIVLTGANLACYRDGTNGVTELLRNVANVPAVQRIRISSLEITAVERAAIDCIADSPKFCRFLHLPLQSGSDRILSAMNRRYTARQYRDAVEHAIARMPRIGLGTDILVGFPGEDDAAFEETIALVKALPFSNLHVFPYSPRPGTRAEKMADQVPAHVKRDRVATLLELEKEKRAAFAAGFLGRPVSVLVEKQETDGTATGWTGEYLEARIRGKDIRASDIITVVPREIQDATLLAASPDTG